jgi:uncharacterized protein (TIGR03435 family)
MLNTNQRRLASNVLSVFICVDLWPEIVLRILAETVLAALLCSPALTQSPEANLKFEVASIKTSTPPAAGPIRLGQQGGPGSSNPGRVTYSLSTIRDLIVDAYSVKRNQVSGGPKWLDSLRFDIVAKVPSGTTKDQVKVMLQNLLSERFKLTLHRETRELPVYALVVGAKGPKLRESGVPETSPASASSLPPRPGIGGMKLGPDGCPETPPKGARRGASFTVMTPNGECMISNGQTMDGLAVELSSRFDRTVIDQTGLNGLYDVRLRYDPSSVPGGRGEPMNKDIRDDPGSGPISGDPPNRIATDGGPLSIFSAIQEQLGLKLESKKANVQLLVIDHVEKTPAQN